MQEASSLDHDAFGRHVIVGEPFKLYPSPQEYTAVDVKVVAEKFTLRKEFRGTLGGPQLTAAAIFINQ